MEVWTPIYTHIKEMLGIKRWDLQALHAGPEEMMILRNWEIFSIPEYVKNQGEKHKERGSLKIWDPPLDNMFKLNIDEVSKGNLCPTR